MGQHPSGQHGSVQHSMNMLYMDSLQRGDQCSPGRTSAWWSLFIWESSRFATYKKYVIQLHTRCRNRSVNFRMIFEKKHSYDPRMLWKIWGSWETEARMGGTFPHGESFWPLLYVSLLLFFSNWSTKENLHLSRIMKWYTIGMQPKYNHDWIEICEKNLNVVSQAI